jgi:hypothetical protein
MRKNKMKDAEFERRAAELEAEFNAKWGVKESSPPSELPHDALPHKIDAASDSAPSLPKDHARDPLSAPMAASNADSLKPPPQVNDQPLAPAPSSAPSRVEQPYWVPAGVEFDEFPDDLKLALAQVVNPTYAELVLNARPGLARTIGLSIVHLMWLECLDHIQLARMGHGCEHPDPNDELGLFAMVEQQKKSRGQSRSYLIERHVRLIGTKLKAIGILATLRDFRSQWPKVESWREGGYDHVGWYIDGPAAPLTEHEQEVERQRRAAS